MAVTIKKFRLVNPHKKRRNKPATSSRSQRAQRRTRKNPVLVSLGFANPHRGPMKRKRKKNTSARRKHRNPFAVTRKAHSFRRRRRNPQTAILGRGTDLLKNGFAALVGLYVTRQLPQLALGARNAGLLGYLANLATALAVRFAVAKAAGPAAGNAALIGGGMYFANRLLNEYASPVGRVLSLSGCGDAHAAGLGELRHAYFPLPVATEPGTLNPVLPAAIRALAAPPPAAPKAMAGMGASRLRSSRMASRF